MAYRSLVRTCGLVVVVASAGCYSQPEVDDLGTDSAGTDNGSTGGSDTSITTEVTTDTNGESTSTSAATDPTGPSTSGPTTDSDSAGSTGSETTGPAPACADGTADPGELCFDTPAEELMVAAIPWDVGVGDLDNDDELDIVVLSRGATGAGELTVLEGDGLGGFGGAPSTYPAPDGGFRVLVVDGDGDGDDDIVAAGGGGISAWTNVDGAFLSNWNSTDNLFLSSLDVSEMVALPVDGGDGHDLLLSEAYSQEFRAGSVTNQRWRLDGAPATIPASGEGAAGLIATKFDFNGNGDDRWDAVLLNQYETDVPIVLGDGAGGFTSNMQTVSLCPFGSRFGEAGDVDGDGDIDLLVICMDGDFGVVLGNGDGTFGDLDVFSLDGAYRPRLVDLDLDGNLDILVSSETLNRLVLYEGAGDGTFELSEIGFAVGGPVHGFAVEDVDQDGALDVLVPWDGGNGGMVSLFRADP